MTTSEIAASSLLLLVSCAGSEPLHACAMNRPALDDCYKGYLFADCGGTADFARLACSADECLWFTGDCAPPEFTATDCPSDDVCCHDAWPFDPAQQDAAYWDLSAKFSAFDTLPWDSLREASLTVEQDPLLTATQTTVDCLGPDLVPSGAGYSPCGRTDLVSAMAVPGTVVISADSQPAVLSGWKPWLEVVETETSVRARFCATRSSDVVGARCAPAARATICATGGAVRVNAWPVEAAGSVVAAVTATFANGLEVQAVLAP